MTDEDIRKLLGGYATGTLTDEEQQALFEAALHDEKLFAALAEEQALREMLDDPAHRAAVLQALEPARKGWGLRWMIPLGIAAALVVTVSTVVLLRGPAGEAPVLTAKVVAPPEEKMESRPVSASPPVDYLRKSRAAASSPAAAAPAKTLEALAEKEVRRAQAPASATPREVLKDTREEAKVASAPPPPPPSPRAVSASAEASFAAPVQARQQGTLNSAGKVQYTIMRRASDGKFKPVDAGEMLQPADAVRLNVAADESGLLSVSQKNPPKVLFQGVVQSQVPVTVPRTGSLDLSNGGPLQIVFSQPATVGGIQLAFPTAPGAVSKKKSEADKDSQKAASGAGARQSQNQSQIQNQAQNQVQNGFRDLAAETITVDVNLNVATPSQQQK